MFELKPPKSVLIIGAGELGSSTALSLVKGAYRDHADLITILDRAEDPPAIDAASSDLNKIVRQDYSDPLYAALAFKALSAWRTPEYSRHFHECGVLVGAEKTHAQAKYVQGSLKLNQTKAMTEGGRKAWKVDGNREVKEVLREVEIGDLSRHEMYFNQAGGWANSRAAVVASVERIREAGVRIVKGEASSLIFKSNDSKIDVCGIKTSDGREYFADFLICTMGAWTPNLIPEVASESLATGQILATIKLDKDEVAHYRNVPIVLFLDTGFYCFPPNEDGIVKFSIHAKGYLNPTKTLPSIPRTTLTPGFEAQQIPPESVSVLRRELEKVYPGLAKKKWDGSRLCWYADRPTGDWLLDYHPNYPSLFLATGDSGHAFKFLPVIGDLILQGIAGEFTEAQKAIWSYHHRVPGRFDGSRAVGFPKILPKEFAKL